MVGGKIFLRLSSRQISQSNALNQWCHLCRYLIALESIVSPTFNSIWTHTKILKIQTLTFLHLFIQACQWVATPKMQWIGNYRTTRKLFSASSERFLGAEKQRQVCSLLVPNFSLLALRFDANLKLKCDKFMFCWHFCLFTFVTARQSQKLSHKVTILKPHSFATSTNDL